MFTLLRFKRKIGLRRGLRIDKRLRYQVIKQE